MSNAGLAEFIYITTVLALIFVLVFVTQIVMIVKFKNLNNQKIKEVDERLNENERLVRSQTQVNDEVIKMINKVNKLLQSEIKT